MPKIKDLTFTQPNILNKGLWCLICYTNNLNKVHWNFASELSDMLSDNIGMGMIDVQRRTNLGFPMNFDKRCPLIILMDKGRILSEISFEEITADPQLLSDMAKQLNAKELSHRLNSKILPCKIYFWSLDDKLVDIRRFTIVCHMDFKELFEIIKGIAVPSTENLIVKYRDDEQEFCSITNQFEFEEAVRVALMHTNMLKLYVSPKSSKEYVIKNYLPKELVLEKSEPTVFQEFEMRKPNLDIISEYGA